MYILCTLYLGRQACSVVFNTVLYIDVNQLVAAVSPPPLVQKRGLYTDYTVTAICFHMKFFIHDGNFLVLSGCPV